MLILSRNPRPMLDLELTGRATQQGQATELSLPAKTVGFAQGRRGEHTRQRHPVGCQ